MPRSTSLERKSLTVHTGRKGLCTPAASLLPTLAAAGPAPLSSTLTCLTRHPEASGESSASRSQIDANFQRLLSTAGVHSGIHSVTGCEAH